jgi:hypothetical protein
MCAANSHVRFGPIADIAPPHSNTSCGEERLRSWSSRRCGAFNPVTAPHSRYGPCKHWCIPMGRRIAHPHLGIASKRPAPEQNQLADHRCEHSSRSRYSFLKIGLVPWVGARLHPQLPSWLKRAYSLLKIHSPWLAPRVGARLHPQRLSSLKWTENHTLKAGTLLPLSQNGFS